TGRKDIALATLLLDGGKAAAALLIARHFAGPEAGLIAGAAAFIGHCFPIWLRFKGGKGVATFFGALLAGLPPVGIAACLAWLLTAFVFRISSLAALAAAAAAPVLAYIFHAGPWGVGFCALLGALIFLRHRANIAKLIEGKESHIGQKAERVE
ncbi:MAG: glycerol-3-phosphate acyltransferase, partial [Hyphomonadaceae bacterium]